MNKKRVMLKTVMLFAVALLLLPMVGMKAKAAEAVEVATIEELQKALLMDGTVHITLQADLQDNGWLDAYKGRSIFPTGSGNYTLDLNGYDLDNDSSYCASMFEVNGSLTVTNSMGNSSSIMVRTNESNASVFTVNKGKSLTIENANIEFDEYYSTKIRSHGGTITIHGGRIGYYWNDSLSSSAIYCDGDTVINIDGGHINGSIIAEKDVKVTGTVQNCYLKFYGYKGAFQNCPELKIALGQKIYLDGEAVTSLTDYDQKAGGKKEAYITGGDMHFTIDDVSIDTYASIGDKVIGFLADPEDKARYILADMKVTGATYKEIGDHIYEFTITGKDFNVEVTTVQGTINASQSGTIYWYVDAYDHALVLYSYSSSGYKMKNFELEKTSAPWNQYADKIEKIVIEPGIKHIGDYAFSYLYNVTEITIPLTVTSIGNGICENRNDYSQILVDYEGSELDWKNIIGSTHDNYALSYYGENIYHSMGGKCGEKAYWRWPDDNPKGVLTIYGTGEMNIHKTGDGEKRIDEQLRGVEIKNVSIESGITAIGEYAFCGTYPLLIEKVTMSDTVTEIKANAFAYTSRLESILWWSGAMKTIGDEAFYESGIETVWIPKGVTTLGSGVFTESKVKSVSLPKSLTSIGSGIFSPDSELTELIFRGTRAQWNAIEKDEWNPKLDMVVCTNADTLHINYSPYDETVKSGMTASFTVFVSHENEITYQWEKSVDGGKTWSGLSGKNASTLKYLAKKTDDGTQFRCTITDTEGFSVVSGSYTLHVEQGVIIERQTCDYFYGEVEVVRSGENMKRTFYVEAYGDDLSYQWQKSTDGGKTWTNSGSEGAKTSSITFNAKLSYNNYQFRCYITDTDGTYAISNPITLQVEKAIVFTKQPTDITVQAGQTVFLSTMTDPFEDVKYSWHYGTPDGKIEVIAGFNEEAREISFVADETWDGYTIFAGAYYSFMYYGLGGYFSEEVTLHVLPADTLVITTQPKDVTVTAGENAKFSIAAKGEGMKYQWQKSTDGGKTWTNSSSTGATTATLSMTAKASFQNYTFRCVVTDKNGLVVTSDAATLTVKETLAIKTQPASKTVTAGTNVSFTVGATGDGLTYQWMKSIDGGKTWSKSGSTGATTSKMTLTAKVSFNGYQFKCVVTDKNGKSLESKAATLTVTAAGLEITTQPTNQSVTTGTNVSFTVGAKGEGLTYQWMKSTDNGKTWVKSGSTGATTSKMTLTAKVSFNGYQFKCVVTDKSGKSVESNAAKLTVTAATATGPVISTQPKSVSVTTGTTVKFTVAATGDTMKYQWKISKDGGASWSNSGSTGATTASLSMKAKLAFNGYQFKCVVTDKNGKSVESKAATLTVTSESGTTGPVITAQPKNVSVATGTEVKFTVTATGTNLKYQWKISKDGGASWSNSGSTGATTAELSMTAKLAFSGYQFKCVVTDDLGNSVTSSAATLTVK